MSSPPNPQQHPETPGPGAEAETGPSFHMSFFVPFPNDAAPTNEGLIGASDQEIAREEAGAGEGGEGNNTRGVMWSFQFQPNRPLSPASNGPRSSTAPLHEGGGRGDQRIPNSLPFSGPLIPPLPAPFPLIANMFPRPPIPTGPNANTSGMEVPTTEGAAPAPAPPSGIPQMIFFVRPDGSVGIDTPIPRHPPSDSASPSEGEPTPSDPSANTRQNPSPFPFPFPFMFPFPFPTDPVPDPEKAKELLRSLPTVEEKVMRRVDRVYAAENTEDGGWKCGVCLEGWEEGEERGQEGEEEGMREMGSTGVKRLPCNHLFHADCLEPWFETKHTCPSCRLDLDPMRTLRSPPSLGLPLRPQPTGSGDAGTRNPHPYRHFHIHRPTAPGPDSAASSPPMPPNPSQPGDLPPPALPGRTGTSSFTVLFGPPPSAAPLARSALEPGSSVNVPRDTAQMEVSSSSGSESSPPIMPIPLRRVGIMPRLSRSSTPAATAAIDSEPTLVQPRFEPVSPQPNTQLPRPHHHHHHHLHHHHHVQHDHPPHFHIHRAAPSPASPIAGPQPPTLPTHAQTPFQFIFPAPPSRPSEPSKPVVHVPLETWLRNKEKGLGWRCDSEDCGIAPTGNKSDAFDKIRLDDKPRLSEMKTVSPNQAGRESAKGCEHKYHPACFAEAVKLLPPDDRCMDLDDEVRAECGICGTEGWVKWRDVEREEDMVERICDV